MAKTAIAPEEKTDNPWAMSGDSFKTTVDVLLPLALKGAYSYGVPDAMTLEEGDYVAVPLGPRQTIGVVWRSPGGDAGEARLRPVAARLDAPAMAAAQRRFIDWIAAYYLEPPGNVLRLALRAPGALGAAPERTGYRASGTLPAKMTAQRQRVMAAAGEGPAFTQSELTELAGVGASVVKGLAAEGALEAVALPADAPFRAPQVMAGRLALSPGQEAAAAGLRAMLSQRGFHVALIDGVTGSGKTEVYFEAMAAALAAGRQVLLLLPEIALTGQFLARVEERFAAAPAEWHSGLRPRERERVWRAVARAEAMIVVGARSALFLPWKKLGLIVVDEEHEPAYKQGDGVSYHARDMAVVYGSLGDFPVVLASATPSLESLYNVGRGRYRHIHLPDRHGRAELPAVALIDMRQAEVTPGRWLSQDLAGEVAATLERGEQALLFLNRRGYAPLTLCRACGHRMACRHCTAWLVEHRFRNLLQCHHCGHSEPVPETCPACAATGKLAPVGPGVERLAEEARARWPDARLAVLSSDLAHGRSLATLIHDIAHHAFDLIIGTQLVAKGHNFPHLTLAGIVDADLALETADPRAGERTWQLLAQVAGRAGRGDRPGRALVQTHLPEHPLMAALERGDRDGFLAQEMAMRRAAGLPPYGRLAALVVSGRDGPETERFARHIARRAPQARDIKVLGPAPAPLSLVRGRHRWRFLVKAPRDADLQGFLKAWLAGVETRGSLRLAVDVDPYSFL